MASRIVEVKLPNGTVALVQAVEVDEVDGGAQQVDWKKVFDLDQLTATLDGVARAVRSGVEKALPSRTTVELGISLAVMTTLIVDGSAQASLTVTLEWGSDK
jgi:Trypsin-co-occurring domain 1